jgi:hypothetical protein
LSHAFQLITDESLVGKQLGDHLDWLEIRFGSLRRHADTGAQPIPQYVHGGIVFYPYCLTRSRMAEANNHGIPLWRACPWSSSMYDLAGDIVLMDVPLQ